MGYSPARMIWRLLDSGPDLPEWFQFADRYAALTYQGRYAIGLMCQLLNIGAGDEILVPAYNCGAEIQPFLWSGAKVALYRIDKGANADLEDVFRRVTPATRVVYVTHFFGWPQEISELSRWRTGRGIYLVEDCALSLFSSGLNNRMGQIGDAAIYSFVKSLPVPDGGALVLSKDAWKEKNGFRAPGLRNVFRSSLPLAKKWFMHEAEFWQRSDLGRRLLGKNYFRAPRGEGGETRLAMLKSNNFDEEKANWSISRLARSILNATDPIEVVEKRRGNYQFLHESLAEVSSFQPLFENLPVDVCPQSFPAYVKDRNRWCGFLEASGIFVGGWPGYHPGFDWDEYPEACALKSNLITLPVHQNLEDRHLEHMVKCVKNLAAQG
jgi:dTDP-4-amino-4,6-dideoxygalactose transaminase